MKLNAEVYVAGLDLLPFSRNSGLFSLWWIHRTLLQFLHSGGFSRRQPLIFPFVSLNFLFHPVKNVKNFENENFERILSERFKHAIIGFFLFLFLPS